MAPTPDPRQQNQPANDEHMDGQPAGVPDEDGPHDVPDDAVIEKTLPTPKRDPGGGDRPR